MFPIAVDGLGTISPTILLQEQSVLQPRALFLDDEESETPSLLADGGMWVDVARSAAEADELLLKNQYDYVLTDVQLDKAHNYDPGDAWLVRKQEVLRSSRKVIISARIHLVPDDRRQTLSAQGVEFVMKGKEEIAFLESLLLEAKANIERRRQVVSHLVSIMHSPKVNPDVVASLAGNGKLVNAVLEELVYWMKQSSDRTPAGVETKSVSNDDHDPSLVSEALKRFFREVARREDKTLAQGGTSLPLSLSSGQEKQSAHVDMSLTETLLRAEYGPSDVRMLSSILTREVETIASEVLSPGLWKSLVGGAAHSKFEESCRSAVSRVHSIFVLLTRRALAARGTAVMPGIGLLVVQRDSSGGVIIAIHRASGQHSLRRVVSKKKTAFGSDVRDQDLISACRGRVFQEPATMQYLKEVSGLVERLKTRSATELLSLLSEKTARQQELIERIYVGALAECALTASRIMMDGIGRFDIGAEMIRITPSDSLADYIDVVGFA